jgi:cyclopropane fatty-acyl-phospholipid synthase-like methyltransferase
MEVPRLGKDALVTYTDTRAVHIDKDQSRGRMIDVYAQVCEFVFGHSYLHWGYWEDPDAVVNPIGLDLIAAQKAFLDKLITFIPPNVKSILEIGSGTGELASLLQKSGYEVACVCPSIAQNRLAKAKLDAGTTIYESRFEDLTFDRTYDLAIFCESFQYMKLPDAFDQLSRCTSQVLITDFYKKSAESGQGSGFSWEAFENALKGSDYEIVTYEDITRNVKPTHLIKRQFYLDLCLPLTETVSERVRQKYPILSHLFLGILRRRLFNAERIRRKGEKSDPERLADWIEYCIMLLRKPG